MATPLKVLALEPPLTWSAASEKLPPNSELTVAPAGLAVSSAIAARVAAPDATGASLTAVTVSDRATTPEEMWVVPPVAPVRSRATPLVMLWPLSIRLALRPGAGPLKLLAGTKRSRSAALRPTAAVALAPVRSIQLAPLLAEYCQTPLAASAV